MDIEGQNIYRSIAKYTNVNHQGGDPTKQSKQTTERAKEAATVIQARYCPYCGGSNVSSIREGALCLRCGASFVTSKVYQKPVAQDTPCTNATSPSARTRPQLFSESNRISTPRFLQERNFIDFSELDKTLNALDASTNVRELARAIYGRAAANRISNDEISARALASAAVYAACKQNELPKSIDEIAAASGADRTEIERSYAVLLNEMGYLSPLLSRGSVQQMNEPEMRTMVNLAAGNEEYTPQVSNVERFLEKKGTYEFLRILKESPRRWKTLEKELALSPRTLSERITQAQELGFIEKVRRLKIGATYYRLTRKGSEILEAMTENTSIY